MPGLNWIVARTKSGRELWAAENVARQGFTYYLPRIEVQRKRIVRAEPLFACYLFVQSGATWRFLLSTFGISGVVQFGNSPASLSDDTLTETVRRFEVEGLVKLPEKSDIPNRFKKGDAIRITGGAFCGYKGIYAGMDPKMRERVLLEFLGRKTPVLLAPELLEAA